MRVPGWVTALVLLALGPPAPACWAAGAGDAAHDYTEVTTPDFVLLSADGEARAQEFARQIVSFRLALESLLGVPLRSSLPTTIFALDGAAWTRFAQPRPGMAGYFTAQAFAADLMFDASTPGRQPVELLLHEYTHHLLRTLGPARLPPFVDEGLAEVFGTAQFAPRGVRFELRADHVALLRGSAWLPFEQLAAVRRRDAHYLDYPLARQFYAQAWATMFYVVAADGVRRQRLPAYLHALRGATAGADTAGVAEALLGRQPEEANKAVSRFLLARPAPRDAVIQIRQEESASPMALRRVGRDEYDVRLGELLLRLGNRATLARGLFRTVPPQSAFSARARVGAALAVLQSGDREFAAALLDEPALAQGLDAATGVALARGLLQLAVPGPELESLAEAVRVQRLARARELFAAALETPCCGLEATHGYVLAVIALQRPEPGLLARALRAHAAAPSNSELAVAVALIHETEGRAAEARAYWAAAARNLQEGPARSRILERMGGETPAE
jgi:hypothetical protein